MSVEVEMLNEENGRLRRHIATLGAHCTNVESELAAYQAVVLPVNVYEALKRIAELEAALDVALEAMQRGSNILSSLTYRQWDTGIHPAGIDILPRIKVAHEQAHDAIAKLREVLK